MLINSVLSVSSSGLLFGLRLQQHNEPITKICELVFVRGSNRKSRRGRREYREKAKVMNVGCEVSSEGSKTSNKIQQKTVIITFRRWNTDPPHHKEKAGAFLEHPLRLSHLKRLYSEDVGPFCH